MNGVQLNTQLHPYPTYIIQHIQQEFKNSISAYLFPLHHISCRVCSKRRSLYLHTLKFLCYFKQNEPQGLAYPESLCNAPVRSQSSQDPFLFSISIRSTQEYFNLLSCWYQCRLGFKRSSLHSSLLEVVQCIMQCIPKWMGYESIVVTLPLVFLCS